MVPESESATSLGVVTPAKIRAVQTSLEGALPNTATLEDAARVFVDTLYREFSGSVPLIRLYGAMPAYRLPPGERQFADQIARGNNADALRDDTLVLTLLGTRGALPEWNDRRKSKGHIAIPLLGARFVESVPMVASLLKSLGADISLFDTPTDVLTRSRVGGFNGTFYVADARSARDVKGRLIIPAQDFVAEQNIRTVFGFGGCYVNGWIVTVILFTSEALRQDQVEPFAPLVTTFKLGTMLHVAGGALFE